MKFFFAFLTFFSIFSSFSPAIAQSNEQESKQKEINVVSEENAPQKDADDTKNKSNVKAKNKQSQKSNLERIEKKWLQLLEEQEEQEAPQTGTKSQNLSTPEFKEGTGLSVQKNSENTKELKKENTQENSASESLEISPALSPETDTEPPSFIKSLFRFILLSSLFITIFYFITNYLKKKSQQRGIFLHGNDLIQVLSSLPVKQGSFVQVIKVAGKYMTIGVSDRNIQFLGDLDETHVKNKIQLWESQQDAQKNEQGEEMQEDTFFTFVNKILQRLSPHAKKPLLWVTKKGNRNSFREFLFSKKNIFENDDVNLDANLEEEKVQAKNEKDLEHEKKDASGRKNNSQSHPMDIFPSTAKKDSTHHEKNSKEKRRDGLVHLLKQQRENLEKLKKTNDLA